MLSLIAFCVNIRYRLQQL